MLSGLSQTKAYKAEAVESKLKQESPVGNHKRQPPAA